MDTFTSNLRTLKTDHIDLWSIDPTQLSEQSITFLTSLLTTEEYEKLLKYKHKVAQHTALITRSLCRLVLSHYTNSSPIALQFVRNSQGKPALINNNNDIRFNLSHNNQLIIMAVCIGDEVGCDIENPLRKVNIPTITKRYFAAQEHQQLSKLTGMEQQQQFFRCWTLKEAFVKATGVGISLGLDTFYFSFTGIAPSDKSEASEYVANDIQQLSLKDNIAINFNSHYPLSKDAPWQFYHTSFKQQTMSICRSSKLNQTIVYRDATSLLGI
ncbi:4'-phosphopantetheinyl transferase superfamily protein [Psychromonas sp. SR45-3]|uniref:4'-phosphopantetheinyl transferase family protein n=1 Tax=Psychromonas sp. SR45-3 TaxID=2760930 RepID=UPI0015F7C933|nr:4'-phosphopantetheinyl transferase superfamily protein [Psychromonas sp. SR45-3]MBB1272400.1 4'-phosphopantetheinyl transferase superfamily protein [Psychromonas sp. SR45-3]